VRRKLATTSHSILVIRSLRVFETIQTVRGGKQGVMIGPIYFAPPAGWALKQW
jgi:hypothetical protein